MRELAALRVKTYSYLTDNNKDKKAKGTKKCVIKRKLKLKIINTVYNQGGVGRRCCRKPQNG